MVGQPVLRPVLRRAPVSFFAPTFHTPFATPGAKRGGAPDSTRLSCLQYGSVTSEQDGLRSRVRQVLLNDWDPHNAARSPAAHSTYDGYITPLLDLLRSGAGEDEVVEFLHERERESMCFPSLGTQRLRPVARKLLALKPPS